MTGFRRLALQHPLLAALACLLALALRLTTPAGFMPVFDHGRVTVELCPGMTSASTTEMPGMQHGVGKEEREGDGTHVSPCAFADLSLAALGSAPAIVLAEALAWSMETALRRTPVSIADRIAGLRPWVRGPPQH